MSGASPTRLLVVSSFYDSHLGGLEVVAARLAQELSLRGFAVSWLATDATPPPATSRVAAIPVRGSNWAERRFGVPVPLLGPRACLRLVKAVREADVVLVHDSLYVTSIISALAAKLYGRPLAVLQHIGVVPYRSVLLRRLVALGDRLVARPMLASAAQVIFISETVRRFFADLRFAAPPQIVFNGVDTSVFKPASAGAARARFGFRANETVALFVGRFVEKKGLHLLREAARRRPEVIWAFAGDGAIDPTAWGLPNVRVFSGLSGAALAELYQASDVLTLPSRGEGFPLVVQEALACGLPVVCGAESTRADPSAAAFLDGVELGEDERENLTRFLAVFDAARGRDAERQARAEFARRRYSWSAAADHYAELLRQAVGSAPASTPAGSAAQPVRAAA